jgi:nicotinamidase-related amidase
VKPIVDHPIAGDALVVVDVQNDFLAGEILAVPQAHEGIPVLNGYLAEFMSRHLPIFCLEEEGALEEVAQLAASWFSRHLRRRLPAS